MKVVSMVVWTGRGWVEKMVSSLVETKAVQLETLKASKLEAIMVLS